MLLRGMSLFLIGYMQSETWERNLEDEGIIEVIRIQHLGTMNTILEEFIYKFSRYFLNEPGGTPERL